MFICTLMVQSDKARVMPNGPILIAIGVELASGQERIAPSTVVVIVAPAPDLHDLPVEPRGRIEARPFPFHTHRTARQARRNAIGLGARQQLLLFGGGLSPPF